MRIRCIVKSVLVEEWDRPKRSPDGDPILYNSSPEGEVGKVGTVVLEPEGSFNDPLNPNTVFWYKGPHKTQFVLHRAHFHELKNVDVGDIVEVDFNFMPTDCPVDRQAN